MLQSWHARMHPFKETSEPPLFNSNSNTPSLIFFLFRNMKISTCALWIPLKHSLFLLDLTSLNSMVNDFKSDKSSEPGIIIRNKKEMLWRCCCIKNIIPTPNGSNTETMMMNQCVTIITAAQEYQDGLCDLSLPIKVRN